MKYLPARRSIALLVTAAVFALIPSAALAAPTPSPVPYTGPTAVLAILSMYTEMPVKPASSRASFSSAGASAAGYSAVMPISYLCAARGPSVFPLARRAGVRAVEGAHPARTDGPTAAHGTVTPVWGCRKPRSG